MTYQDVQFDVFNWKEEESDTANEPLGLVAPSEDAQIGDTQKNPETLW